ncbi:MAG: hypothetical protein K6G07_06480 [Lachnospiraceae bacterium]|nr:hypothetical protein [Lachnospiraceae bacterium]
MASQRYLVEGYSFPTKEEADRAAKELSKIQVLNQKIDPDQLSAIKALYVRAVDGKAFETEMGLNYLRSLQMHLVNEGAMAIDEKPLPINYCRGTMEDELIKVKEEYEVLMQDETDKAQAEVQKAKRELRASKKVQKNMTIAIIILIIMVAGMFGISFTGKNANILNYRNAIIEEYSEWEQELSEREAKIRQKEAELNMN